MVFKFQTRGAEIIQTYHEYYGKWKLVRLDDDGTEWTQEQKVSLL